jgi:hypothetical protein
MLTMPDISEMSGIGMMSGRRHTGKIAVVETDPTVSGHFCYHDGDLHPPPSS